MRERWWGTAGSGLSRGAHGASVKFAADITAPTGCSSGEQLAGEDHLLPPYAILDDEQAAEEYFREGSCFDEMSDGFVQRSTTTLLHSTPTMLSMGLDAASMAVTLPDGVDGEGRVERAGRGASESKKGAGDVLVVPWGMRFLVAQADAMMEATADQRRELRAMVLEARPHSSKWYDPRRPGQGELYEGLERVLQELKAFTPHSIPFLHRVSKKEVPDYHLIIRNPMDLSTMHKKLKSLLYLCKADFAADLQLIYDNCFAYNTAEDSGLRRAVRLLREKWTLLLCKVPDIHIVPVVDGLASTPLRQDQGDIEGEEDEGESQAAQEEDYLEHYAEMEEEVDLEQSSSDLLQSSMDGGGPTTTDTFSPPIVNGATPPGHTNMTASMMAMSMMEGQRQEDRLTAFHSIMIVPCRNARLMRAYSRMSSRLSSASGDPFITERAYFCNAFPDTRTIEGNRRPRKRRPSLYGGPDCPQIRSLQALLQLRSEKDHGTLEQGIQQQPPQHLLDLMGPFGIKKSLGRVLAVLLGSLGVEAAHQSALSVLSDLLGHHISRSLVTLKEAIRPKSSVTETTSRWLSLGLHSTPAELSDFLEDDGRYHERVCKLAEYHRELADRLAHRPQRTELARVEDDPTLLGSDMGAMLGIDIFGFKELGLDAPPVPARLLKQSSPHSPVADEGETLSDVSLDEEEYFLSVDEVASLTAAAAGQQDAPDPGTPTGKRKPSNSTTAAPSAAAGGNSAGGTPSKKSRPTPSKEF